MYREAAYHSLSNSCTWKPAGTAASRERVQVHLDAATCKLLDRQQVGGGSEL